MLYQPVSANCPGCKISHILSTISPERLQLVALAQLPSMVVRTVFLARSTNDLLGNALPKLPAPSTAGSFSAEVVVREAEAEAEAEGHQQDLLLLLLGRS